MLTFQSCVDVTRKETTPATNQLSNIQEVQVDSIKGAYLKVDKKQHNFGEISRRKMPKISVEFIVENIGKMPLLIFKTDVSCGCLSVDYPIAPIRSGEKVKLTVNVDTKSQEGMFNKAIFIKSNANNDLELIRIRGAIKK